MSDWDEDTSNASTLAYDEWGGFTYGGVAAIYTENGKVIAEVKLWNNAEQKELLKVFTTPDKAKAWIAELKS